MKRVNPWVNAICRLNLLISHFATQYFWGSVDGTFSHDNTRKQHIWIGTFWNWGLQVAVATFHGSERRVELGWFRVRFTGKILRLIAHRPEKKSEVYGANKAELQRWNQQHLPKTRSHGEVKNGSTINQMFRELLSVKAFVMCVWQTVLIMTVGKYVYPRWFKWFTVFAYP